MVTINLPDVASLTGGVGWNQGLLILVCVAIVASPTGGVGKILSGGGKPPPYGSFREKKDP